MSSFMNVEFKGLKSQPCCPPEPKTLGKINAPWADGVVSTPVGDVPRARTEYLIGDRLGTFKARWGVGRMRYTVEPGLYAVGNPTADSTVFVSANYKMSFDRLRRELTGMDAWLLVLDTKGINVWCAAGKGTFGTAEIVRSIAATGLDKIVSHRALVLPQLGAPGVSAHEVKKQSGFSVVYGPVRASDIPEFMSRGMRATPEMRRVRFPLTDRVALIPMELVLGAKWALAVAAALFALGRLVKRAGLRGGICTGHLARLGASAVDSGQVFLGQRSLYGSCPHAGVICHIRDVRKHPECRRLGADNNRGLEFHGHELHRLVHLHFALWREARDALRSARPAGGRGARHGPLDRREVRIVRRPYQ
jgi:hypothetical protein